MTITRSITILLGALWCLAPIQMMAADEGCPDLKGTDAAAHLEYLRGDRSKLVAPCIVAAIRYVGGKHFTQGGAVLIQYLDYQDVYLRLTHKGEGKSVDACMGLAVGSVSIPDSMISLGSGQTLLIRAGEFLSATWPWHEAGFMASIVDVKVLIHLKLLEDNRLYLRNRFEDAVSTKPFEIVWKRE